jgi:hypothetical protein
MVTIHRWQERSKRYNRQRFEMDHENNSMNWLGIAFGECQGEGYKQMRTQFVERIEVNSFRDTVDIYTQPLAGSRIENRRKRAMTPEKHAAVDRLGPGV